MWLLNDYADAPPFFTGNDDDGGDEDEDELGIVEIGVQRIGEAQWAALQRDADGRAAMTLEPSSSSSSLSAAAVVPTDNLGGSRGGCGHGDGVLDAPHVASFEAGF